VSAPPQVSISIVSHGHGHLIADLLSDVQGHADLDCEVLLTLNIPESLPFSPDGFRFPVHINQNPVPKGFGANHNAAFQRSRHELFCVLNPDVRLPSNPFPELFRRLQGEGVGVVAPLVRDPDGQTETSARRFPTPGIILRKALLGPEPRGYEAGDPDLMPDWVGGMFMLFPREAFAEVGGFDERYHLYYEDVDLCARLRLAGRKIVFCPTVEVVHAARRESHRNLRYFAWHMVSMLRFFLSKPFRQLVLMRRNLPRTPADRRP